MIGDLYLMLSFSPGTIVAPTSFEMDHSMNAACKRGDARKLDASNKKDRALVAACSFRDRRSGEIRAGRDAFRDWFKRGLGDAAQQGEGMRADGREVGDPLWDDLRNAVGHADAEDDEEA